ncbi:AraC family transcriptional regulator [Scytonema millei]|uniref:Helix-turn-helix transcriptional regulator n=1 Tax=Scytonema millei VB511283 TaxID=1245923 RepID=A0A9X5E994_9CYAN|nr:AraC family transcriptional regulator [Scytonema millei]NHC37281.1 helix-turn-helix transcriptional regulator [Scytonema millei VB511283]
MTKSPFVVNTFQQETIFPILPVAPILSSANRDWDGIHVGYYRQPAWETPEATFLQHTITIYTGQPVNVELQAEGRWQQKTYTKGAVGIYPAFIPHIVNWNSEIEFIEIDLDPQTLNRFVDDSININCYEIIPQSAINDPLIYSIGMALKTELESSGGGDRLYAESATTMLAAHIFRHYSTQNLTLKEAIGGLPKSKLREVIDYIQTHLGRNVSLVDLAALVQISPHHFARLFKQSTGYSPHQYLLNCRIQAAKNLLAKQDLSIADIALQVGFHDQSRFTSVFRKHTGITPKKYRDRI